MSSARALVVGDVAGRLVAFVVDAFLLGVATFLLLGIVSVLVGPAIEVDLSVGATDRVVVDRARLTAHAGMGVALAVAYFAGSWVLAGATPGQRWLGLDVAATDGGRLGWGAAVARLLLLGAPLWWLTALAADVGIGALVLQGFGLLWSLLLLLSTAASPQRRGWHDRLAGSVVTRRVAAVAQSQPDLPAVSRAELDGSRVAPTAQHAGE